MGTKKSLLEHRSAVRELQDELPEYDRQFHLCRTTGYTYVELLSLMAQDGGYIDTFAHNLGYAKLLTNKGQQKERKWWTMIAEWMKEFIPQWEKKFVSTVKDLITLPDPEAILQASAKALNIEPEILAHFIEHKEEIEIFLEAQRGTLGVLAESQLWKLVAEGDPATVRWVLSRIKSEHYGDKKVVEDTPRTIKIIEG